MAESKHEGVKWRHHLLVNGTAALGLASAITSMYVPAVKTPALTLCYICAGVLACIIVRVIHRESQKGRTDRDDRSPK
jgi:hypothetical protein